MKTKIVYVLTSSEKDYYLEQMIISMHSLKMHNPDAKISLVVDDKTAESFVGKREGVKAYVDELKVIPLDSNFSQKERSRIMKTSLRDYLEGDYLFIDTDTVIAGDLSDIDSFTFDIGAVLDKHIPIQNHDSKIAIENYARKMGWDIPANGHYFNSGVMYVKDNGLTHKFYATWRENWTRGQAEHGIAIDQPSMALTNAQLGYIITEIPGAYNCQILYNGLKYLIDAKIIHYFASNMRKWDCAYLFRDKAIYESVKTSGVTQEIEDRIANAKSAFTDKCTILGGNQCDAYGSVISGFGRRIVQRFGNLSTKIDKWYWTHKK